MVLSFRDSDACGRFHFSFRGQDFAGPFSLCAQELSTMFLGARF